MAQLQIIMAIVAGLCTGLALEASFQFSKKKDVSQSSLIEGRARELYIEYKACEKVEEMINGK